MQAKIIAEPGKQELTIERTFNAPRGLVFKAFTDPEIYKKWIGPSYLVMNLETFDSRSGGSWRYTQSDKEGNVYAFHGVNHEVKSPERIISTFEYENLPESGHVVLQVAYFEELPEGKTKVMEKSVFLTVEDRDGMIQSGMEEGLNDSYNKLDEILEKMKNSRHSTVSNC